MNLLPAFVDERFLQHRLRASSTAGIACAVLALVLAYYRYFHNHIVSRDLIAVASTFLIVKYVLFFWYRRTS
ncbi:MAG TPA: hypothetical protein VJ867_04515 [Gemmatimonadaceae bacterium]|nr:hypothetical protein [Gemmatimonadaceae bacterium]